MYKLDVEGRRDRARPNLRSMIQNTSETVNGTITVEPNVVFTRNKEDVDFNIAANIATVHILTQICSSRIGRLRLKKLQVTENPVHSHRTHQLHRQTWPLSRYLYIVHPQNYKKIRGTPWYNK